MVKYQATHEWVTVEGDIATIGISVHAAEQLGEIVFVELPEVGDTCTKGDTVSNVESAKAVGEVVTPYSGEIVEVNEALDDAPENVSENALGTFIFKVKIANPGEGADLLDEAGYKATL